jgi:hypothetical protein
MTINDLLEVLLSEENGNKEVVIVDELDNEVCIDSVTVTNRVKLRIPDDVELDHGHVMG